MRNKLGKKYAFAIITTVVLMVYLTGCESNSKLNSYLDQGEERITNGDYTGAMEAYQAAIDLDVQSIKAHLGMLQSMLKAQSSYTELYNAITVTINAAKEMAASENGITEEQRKDIQDYFQLAADTMKNMDVDVSLEILEAGIEVLGPDSAVANDYKDNIQQLVDRYLKGNNFSKAREYASRLEKALPEDSAVKSTVAEVQEQYDLGQPYVDVLLRAVDLIEASDWQGLADLAETEEALALAEKIGDVGNYTYMFDGGSDGMSIGYYSMEGCECNEWYYGNLANGQRDGDGGWYWAKNDSEGLYIDNYVGQWVNDMPNGAGHAYLNINGSVYKDEDITVKDGLVHGTFTHVFTLESGESYESTYTVVDGIYQEVEIEDWLKEYVAEGKYVFCVVYYDVDGGRNASYLTCFEDSCEGVAHYRY